MKQAVALTHVVPTNSGSTPDPHRATDPSSSSNNLAGGSSHEDQNPLRQFLRITKGLHTLIVEDDHIDQKIAVGAAAQLGMRWELVDSGQLAIEKLRAADEADPFDLILLDYKLPNLDGLTACKHIKTEVHLSHLPRILLLSAYHKDEIFHVHSDRSLVDGFITKPVSPHFLGSLVTEQHNKAREQGEYWPNLRRNDDELLSRCHVLLAEDNTINQKVDFI